MKGTVKWFNDQKGYGFITDNDGSGDAFVHYSNITSQGFKTLSEGAVVEYEIEPTEKGSRAINVRKIGATDDIKQQSGSKEEPVTEASSQS